MTTQPTPDILMPIPEGCTLGITLVTAIGADHIYDVVAAEARDSAQGEIIAYATIGDDLVDDERNKLPDWAQQAIAAIQSGEPNVIG